MITLFVDSCRSLLTGKIRPSFVPDAMKNDGSWRNGGWLFNGNGRIFGLSFKGGLEKAQTCRRLAAEIPALVKALRQTTCKAEQDFLKLGDELQTIYGRTSDLARQIVGAISTIDSEDGTGTLHELQALVRESLAKMTAFRSEAASKKEVIRMIAADVAGLGRYCSEAERMATYLTVIGFNIRIESAQKEEFDKLFGVIADEIRKSTGRIVEIIDRIRDDAASLCRDQTQVSCKIATDLAELGALADKADLLVSRAFGQIEELISLACSELCRAGDHSTTLTRQVGEIVMGIQLYDSMNQRIGQIIEALQDVERMIRDGAAEQVDDMVDIFNLQQARLQNLVAEVEEVYGRTQEAFASIGFCVDQLTGSLAGFAEQRDSTAGNPFDQLSEAFLQLDGLLGSGTGLIVDIDELSEKTAGSAGKLSLSLEQIQDISFQTRLIGLNSIVNAARLGEQGQIFEVLSNQLTGMTEYSNTFVGAAERIVGSIRDHIEKTRRQKTDDTAGDGGRDLSIGEVIENSSKQYRRFHEMSVSAGTVAEVVREDLARIQGELDFLGRLQQELLEWSHRCGELAMLLHPWAGTGQKSSEGYRRELAERYTRQQERDIHENMMFLPTAAAAAFPDDGGPAAEDEKAFCDDNVELF
jgi:methyl-accepting chemotaxis protein